jgi:hypothetical protein
MTENYTCSCWDETIYKGPTCKESCVQVRSGGVPGLLRDEGRGGGLGPHTRTFPCNAGPLVAVHQYCSGRGVCKPGNKTLCDCWDPVRWSGDRCEVSVCGPHGIVIAGDYTNGTSREGLWLRSPTLPYRSRASSTG